MGMASGPDGSPAEEWAGPKFTIRTDDPAWAAVRFLKEVGVADPTLDAVKQLIDVFVPCLKIMCERGYDPTGATWREGGWRSQLVDVRKKFSRLWRHGWLEGRFVPDHSLDLINYTGFYHRIQMQGKPWGEWGEPEESK